MSNAGASSPIVTNCTFASNSACWGGGMSSFDSSPAATVTNCIFWGDTLDNCAGSSPPDDPGPEIWYSHTPPTVTYCNVQGGYSGEKNINRDPLFIPHTDRAWILSGSSPCINAGKLLAGLPLVDIEGNHRIYNDSIDIGAHECRNLSPVVVNPLKDIIVYEDNGPVMVPLKTVFFDKEDSMD